MVDWHAEKAPDLMFRQDPGKGNAMSSTKINFHNPHAVYMHDTPQQGVFNQLMRFESSGCVRVQNVRDLNTWLLRDTPGWNRQAIEATIASGETPRSRSRAGAGLLHLFHRMGVRGRHRAVPRRCLPARRCRRTGTSLNRRRRTRPPAHEIELIASENIVSAP
jgi:hypothetical protein